MVPADLDLLAELVQGRNWNKVLHVCEELLLRGGYSLPELVYINYAICVARIGMGDYYGAIPSGQLAIKLGKDADLWDDVGLLCLHLGTSQVYTRQHEQALTTLYEYFEYKTRYGLRALAAEGEVWLMLGAAYDRQGDCGQAMWALEHARDLFHRQGDESKVFQCVSAMIACACNGNPSNDVTDWLRETIQYVRRHRRDQDARSRYLLHRAMYLLKTNRPQAALSTSRRALRIAKNDPELQFRLHMLLYEGLRARMQWEDALGYALGARSLAVQMQRFDLEYQAAEGVYDLLKQRGDDVLQSLEQEYLSSGLDLARLLDDDGQRKGKLPS